jgi:type II secretory pathway component GspD/PulD (secretin)
VPGLANIPVLGKLFRNKRQSDQNEELLIFITPRVIQL